MKQEVEAALNLISRVCAGVQANLADHQAMQAALRVIKEEIDPPAQLVETPAPDEAPEVA